MALPRSLRSLLRIRDLEEEQQRALLEAALAEQHLLEDALASCLRQEELGRQLYRHELTGPVESRQAALVHLEVLRARGEQLRLHLRSAREEVNRCRQQFLEKRVEKRQAESLLERERASAARREARTAQQSLDDLFATLHPRAHGPAESLRGPDDTPKTSSGSDGQTLEGKAERNL